jgi:NADH-quinone oxidoreductase subunit N
MILWVTAACSCSSGSGRLRGAGTRHAAFGGMFVDDAFARFAKVMILFSAAAVLAMSEGYMSGAASCGSSIRSSSCCRSSA